MIFQPNTTQVIQVPDNPYGVEVSSILHSRQLFKNLDGHFVVMCRADADGVANGNYRGHGAIFGSIYPTARNRAPGVAPCAMLETWARGTPLDDDLQFLLRDSASPRLFDGPLKVKVWTKKYAGENYFGYSLSRLGYGSQYDPPWTTGDVLDNNWHVPNGHYNIGLGLVGGSSEVELQGFAITPLKSEQRTADMRGVQQRSYL